MFKAGSPTCGLSGVKVAGETAGLASSAQAGLFARVLLQACPQLPVEDERRMCSPEIRQQFLRRVFARHHALEGAPHSPSPDALTDLLRSDA